MPEEVNSRNVTQSYQSCVSPFSNHLADTAHAGRGGSLHVRFSDGQVVNLLAVADWSAISGGKPAANTVAVRNPAVNWAADKAIFSMVIGAPSGPSDTTTFTWQLYEITLPTQTQLNASVKPVITKVANQPAYNNIMPCYGLGGKIIFASDRPYNGASHLTQREEYLGLPTVSGLWSLDPTDASSIQILHHSPSGAFSPTIDSAGRVIFTNWDHLSRDSEAVTDSRAGDSTFGETFAQTFNGSGNFDDETAGATFTPVTAMAANSWDIFPEPRNFDKKALSGTNVNGNAFNIFLPWAINPDGTNVEIVNHVGRHEVGASITKSFTNDSNIVDLNPAVNPGYGGMSIRNFFGSLMWTREDPLTPGAFYGSDAPDLGTHGAGQIVRMNKGNPGQNPDSMTVTYITAGATAAKPSFLPVVRASINQSPTGLSPLINPETLYRSPVPLADGNLIASEAANVTQTDYNSGTLAQPQSLYTFRLTSLKLSSGTYVPDVTLTSGLTINTSYYDGGTLITYNGTAWELDPAEVAPRTAPTAATSPIDPIEAAVFAAQGVHIPTFQKYLRSKNAALSVSRNVTKRDLHDRQQPFNLKISWSNTQTTGTSGTIYSVGWIQFLQADLRRGYTLGAGSPAPGRRVVATPLHDTLAENVQSTGAPAGSLKLGDDGSFAAILPAGKAITWHLLDNDTAKTSQVKERFWVTFQPGEIRTCANCHGINTSDQSGTVANPVGKPTNAPAALAALLTQWKASHPAGSVQHSSSSASPASGSTSVTLHVSRTGGSTGPASVDYATVAGTAQANVDFTPASGTLSWADGDTADQLITITLPANPSAAASSAFTVVLSNATYASLGSQSSATITLTSNAPPVATVVLAVKGKPVTGASADLYATIKAPGAGPFIGSILTGKKKVPAIFAADGSELLKPSDKVGGLSIGKILASNGDAALVQFTGVPATTSTGLVTGLKSGSLRVSARQGDLGIKTFGAFDGNGATTFFLSRLADGHLALAAALGDGSVRILARVGDTFGSTTITSLTTLASARGSLAEGRWRLDDHTIGVRVTGADGTTTLCSIPDTATDSTSWTQWAATGAQFTGFGLPGFGANGPAFLSKLPLGIFRVDSGGTTQLAVAGGTYKLFSDPVSGAARKTAFMATLTTGAKSIWYAPDGITPAQLARTGDAAPGGGKWQSFTQLVLPDASTSGPVFTARLAIDKAAQISAKNNVGLWAVDSNGTLRLLLRTGGSVSYAGQSHTVQRFNALAPTGLIGAANGYDDTHVAVLVTCTDKSVALINLAVP